MVCDDDYICGLNEFKLQFNAVFLSDISKNNNAYEFECIYIRTDRNPLKLEYLV